MADVGSDVCSSVVPALLGAPDLVCELPAGHAGEHRQGVTTWTEMDGSDSMLRRSIEGRPEPSLDASTTLLPAWVQPHTAYVARCGECRATPDQDGSEFRCSPWDAARVVNEVEGWRIENGVLLCPDCACIDCPACHGSGDKDGFLVPTEGAEACPECKGETIAYRGEKASYAG